MPEVEASIATPSPSLRMRLDKWLIVARFLKSRSQASALCGSGRLRLNGRICGKAHQTIMAGDVLTFPQGRAVRVIRIRALTHQRGPSWVARGLYDDLATPDGDPKTAALDQRKS